MAGRPALPARSQGFRAHGRRSHSAVQPEEQADARDGEERQRQGCDKAVYRSRRQPSGPEREDSPQRLGAPLGLVENAQSRAWGATLRFSSNSSPQTGDVDGMETAPQQSCANKLLVKVSWENAGGYQAQRAPAANPHHVTNHRHPALSRTPGRRTKDPLRSLTPRSPNTWPGLQPPAAGPGSQASHRCSLSLGEGEQTACWEWAGCQAGCWVPPEAAAANKSSLCEAHFQPTAQQPGWWVPGVQRSYEAPGKQWRATNG